jgi:hypothetical protein
MSAVPAGLAVASATFAADSASPGSLGGSSGIGTLLVRLL